MFPLQIYIYSSSEVKLDPVNVVSTNGIIYEKMQLFGNRGQDLFKRCIDNVSFRNILGLGSWLDFL